MRLQKFFSECGLLSRRAAEAEIAAGRVRINGEVAKLGDCVDPTVDVVEYKGKRVCLNTEEKHVYLMLNKPRGIVTSAKDEKGRKTVTDLVASLGVRVYPVGRLDMDSQGLLLLTNDGDFTNRLTHPRHEIPKIYHVTFTAIPTKEQLAALNAPMELDGYRLQPIKLRKLSPDTLEIQLFEGRNRQIRRMCENVGLRVSRLCRVAIGKISLGELPLGSWRHLKEEEVAYLYAKEEKKGT